MLERYLLSTLTNKFGHIFQDIDEHTTAEWSAWRGVLILRNLHLKKDALRHLGGRSEGTRRRRKGRGGVGVGDGVGIVPLTVGDNDWDDDESDVDNDDWADNINDSDDSESESGAENDNVFDTDDVNNGDDSDIQNDDDLSDEDSFQSCASHFDTESESSERIPRSPAEFQANAKIPEGRQTRKEISGSRLRRRNRSKRKPVIEIVHGSIGSLELHIPWKLIRFSRPLTSSTSQEKSDTLDLESVNDGLKCSAVLSDVRILLAPCNHTRGKSRRKHSQHDDGGLTKCRERKAKSSLSKNQPRQKHQDKVRNDLEAAVQSLLEAELLRRVRVRGRENHENQGRESLLARWAKGMIARILSSLHVTIRNIHVRYEDEGRGWSEDLGENSTSDGPLRPLKRQPKYRPSFAVGMRLEIFFIKTADSCTEISDPSNSPKGRDGGLSAVLRLRDKVAKVKNLSVYWDSAESDLFVSSETTVLDPSDGDALDDRMYYERRFDEMDETSSEGVSGMKSSHQFLILPISPSLHLKMADASSHHPDSSQHVMNYGHSGPSNEIDSDAQSAVHVALHLPSCHIGFDRNTLEDIAYLRKSYALAAQRMTSFNQRREERRIIKMLSYLRPGAGVRPMDDARGWWKYAISAVKIMTNTQPEQENPSKKLKWKRSGWIGLSRLLRLRSDYTGLYLKLWTSSPNDVEHKNKIHSDLNALEEALTAEEIAAFRFSVYSRLSQTFDNGLDKVKAVESVQQNELALGRIEASTLEYREQKMRQIIQVLKYDVGGEEGYESETSGEGDSAARSLDYSHSAMLVCSISNETFSIQTNDVVDTQIVSIASIQPNLSRRPIARSDFSFALRLESFQSGSWKISCDLSSLSVFDLISPTIDSTSEMKTLVSRKENTSYDHGRFDHNAKIVIRNIAGEESESNSTTFLDVTVSPLEVTYSTNAFEALSRLFAAVKTKEFSKDYENISQALARWRAEQRKRLLSVLAKRKKLIVSVDIAAPVLVVPDDLQNQMSTALVFDFGHFLFQTDNNSSPLSKYDDKWRLQMADVRALCRRSNKATTGSLSLLEHAIIEPFSLNTSISTHVASTDSIDDATDVLIEATLPRLSFNLSSSASRLVSRLQARWNDATRRSLQRRRRSSIDKLPAFSNMEPSWRLRHPEFLKALKRYQSTASEVPPETSLANNQKITFSFSAPLISFQISNDINFDRGHASSNVLPIMNLSIHGIRGCNVTETTADGKFSKFTARLRSVYGCDMEKNRSPLRHFLSSVEPIDGLNPTHDHLGRTSASDIEHEYEDEDLVIVELSTKSNGDKKLSIHFNELFIEWNPEFLARIQTTLRLPSPKNSTVQSDPAYPINIDTIDTTSSHETEFLDASDDRNESTLHVEAGDAAEEPCDEALPKLPAPSFNVTFHLSRLRVNFNKDSQMRCLFIAEMNRTQISYCLKPLGGSKIGATVADARMLDPDGATGETLYGQIIGLQQSAPCGSSSPTSMFQMKFESFPHLPCEKLDPFNCGRRDYDNLMHMKFSPMKFVFLNQLLLEIFDYFFEGILGNAVWGAKQNVPSHKVNPLISGKLLPFKRTKFSIEMDDPVILLPVCYRSPQHIRLQMECFKAANHFSHENMNGRDSMAPVWVQWFNNCDLEFRHLVMTSWEGHILNEVSDCSSCPSSMTIKVKWPVGPFAHLVKPKWNVNAVIDPLQMRFFRKDFALLQFFVSMNIMEQSRLLSRPNLPNEISEKYRERLVLFGYEKTWLPPTTYSINFSCKIIQLWFMLDDDESSSGKIEGMMNMTCSNASWSLLKMGTSKQHVRVEKVRLSQTNGKLEWRGFPDLLLPSVASPDSKCILDFTSTSYPNGNNAKSLSIDQACIYLVIPAWNHVLNYFKYLPNAPEVFTREEMPSIMQIGDRFYRLQRNKADAVVEESTVLTLTDEKSCSKQFFVTLTSPQIILPEDPSCQSKKKSSITLLLSHLNYLNESRVQYFKKSLFCDGLKIIVDESKKTKSNSSLLGPLSFSGALSKTLHDHDPTEVTGWMWSEKVIARPSYSDLISAISVVKATNHQLESLNNRSSGIKGTVKTRNGIVNTRRDNVISRERDELPEITLLRIEALCDGVDVVLVDDSFRHFANAQPLVEVSLDGLRYSRADTIADNDEHGVVKIFFGSVESLDMHDLLQSNSSPFRLIATSSESENSNPRRGTLYPFDYFDSMSWESFRMVSSHEWGFQIAPPMQERQDFIFQLPLYDCYFQDSPQNTTMLAVRKISHENGSTSVELNFQHLTAQWNPSTVIALQRFLGRLKKATLSLKLATERSLATAPELHLGVTAYSIAIGSVCICLNKEYQQRRLLDAIAVGLLINFNRFRDNSYCLRGSLKSLNAWDPDTRRPLSDRNRFIFHVKKNSSPPNNCETPIKQPSMSFQYRTFCSEELNLSDIIDSPITPFPSWIEDRICSGDIDDALFITMDQIEFIHLRERTAELLDYLNNGLPGKGMGATSKAAQTFCVDRIKKRSFLDFIVDNPQVFIPRSSSSTSGGCLLSLGNVSVMSWFEEALAFSVDRFGSVDLNEISPHSASGPTMDWWRILGVKLSLGISTEVDDGVVLPLNSNGLLEANVTIRKPMFGKTTVINGSIAPTRLRLKYREYKMLNLIIEENVGIPIDESGWENLEKSYWQEEGTADAYATNVAYADSARFVTFGEAKKTPNDGCKLNFQISIESVDLTLHRDEWFDNLDKETASLMCYDVCSFVVSELEASAIFASNGDVNIAISLAQLHIFDIGDYGRLARDLYLGKNKHKSLPCAFDTVVEGYGKSSEDKLVAITFTRTYEMKSIEFKVNRLSVTVLTRPLEEVIDFFSSKWPCPNLGTTNNKPFCPKENPRAANPKGAVNFKFVALHPRLILLADECDPFSRALILRGLAVANVNIIKDEASQMPSDEEVDIRSTTTLRGHLKHLETLVHNNIDNLIGPACKDIVAEDIAPARDVQSLIEPVTVTVEFTVVNRERFPTSRYLFIEVDPVATHVSFSDLNLIETVAKKLQKKDSLRSKVRKKTKKYKSDSCSPIAYHHNTLQTKKSSKSEGYSMNSLRFDVVVSTEKLGLNLRKCGQSIIVEKTTCNPSVHVGDELIAINGSPITNSSLTSIAEMISRIPRPLTATFERNNPHSLPQQTTSFDSENSSRMTFVASSNDESDSSSVGEDISDEEETECPNEDESNFDHDVTRFSLKCWSGMPTGLNLHEGVGGSPVVNDVDYDLIRTCAVPNDYLDKLNCDATIQGNKKSLFQRLPLPGSVLVLIDGVEVSYEGAKHFLLMKESDQVDHGTYTLTFVEASSSLWQDVTTVNFVLSLKVTFIDDTNGRDMPVIRVGVSETTMTAKHGIGVQTELLSPRQPLLLSSAHNKHGNKRTLNAKLEADSIFVEYYNALINQWEPFIEPHFVGALFERLGGDSLHSSLCSIAIYDHIEKSRLNSSDFVCVNLSDAAVNILGKSFLNWNNCRQPKESHEVNSKDYFTLLPNVSPGKFSSNAEQKYEESPVVKSSSAELKRATNLAKVALDLSRKRGKIDRAEKSPFILKNRAGLRVNFSSEGMATAAVDDGCDAQFEMVPMSSPDSSMDKTIEAYGNRTSRFRNYEGKFPTVELKLDFNFESTLCNTNDHITSDIITDLPTGKVGKTVRSVRIWNRTGAELFFTRTNIVWTVELEENRRILTLSSATSIDFFGCGPIIEVGIKFPRNDEQLCNEIQPIGVTVNNKFHMPIWVESCLCPASIYVRPIARRQKGSTPHSIYEWCNLPILELAEVGRNLVNTEFSRRVIEVQCRWMTEVNILGGVYCPLSRDNENFLRPIWMTCSFSQEMAENDRNYNEDDSIRMRENTSSISLSIWSTMTVRNMLPCSVEWEVTTDLNSSILDGSELRHEQWLFHGITPLSSRATLSSRSNLQCGKSVEIFAETSFDKYFYARFKCIVRDCSFWSEWVKIGVSEGTMRKARSTDREASKQINLQCIDPSGDRTLTIGARLLPRLPIGRETGRGFNLIIYAEIWIRNLTKLPLTFGAPSAQVENNNYNEMPLLSGKVSAESALVELTSVLDTNGFGLFGAGDDDNDEFCRDNVNLPLQQCDEVFDEVFEYVSLNENGNIERSWWASEDHISLRKEPNNSGLENEFAWHVDCAGESFLKNGWESCANISGSKSYNFIGRRTFNSSHRFRRRRWYRKVKPGTHQVASEISEGLIFHQPADLDKLTRTRKEAERNTIGVHLKEREHDGSLLDIFNRSIHQDGILDIMTAVANDGSILISVKCMDGRWSSPAIIPPSGSSNGVIRMSSSRWPTLTTFIGRTRQKGTHLDVTNRKGQDVLSVGTVDPIRFGMAPLEPTVFELCYQVTMLPGMWGELSRMLTITPRFLLKNESTWLDIVVKQVGSDENSRILIKRGEMVPFYWTDGNLPELVCARPNKDGFKWSGGFDLCTLGMLPLRLRLVDSFNDDLILSSLSVNVEIQPGTGGVGTTISLRDEDPTGEGSLFRIENHSPFQVYFSQDGILADPSSSGTDSSTACDVINPGYSTSYALDVPWRQGKYEDRSPASHQDLLLVRCALAPLGTREGAESTKVICFDRVGDAIRLSPSKLSSTLGSFVATELLGVRVLGLVATDGPTRVLRFILMQKEVTPSSVIGNAMRETIYPVPSYMSTESSSQHQEEQIRHDRVLSAASKTSRLLNTGKILDETAATREAFFGIGGCKTSDQYEKRKCSEGVGDEFSLKLVFNGFIFSIIDSSPSELAVLSLHDMQVFTSWNTLGKDYAKIKFAVGWIQLDNHCPNAPYPVAFCPSRGKNLDDINFHGQPFSLKTPFLEVQVDVAPRHRTGIRVLSAAVIMRNLSIFLDLAFIMRMQRFLLGVQDHFMGAIGGTASNFIDSQEIWEHPDIEGLIKKRIARGKDVGLKTIYIQRLSILPCTVRLSVAPVRALSKYQEQFEGKESSAIHAAVRKGDLLVGEGSGVIGVKIGSKNRTALAVVRGMMKSILVDALLRCDGASLNFEGVALWNHLSNKEQLATYLGAHYLASLISNVPALLGSLAAFGNPVGLIRDLGDGMSDFVNEPMKGFKKSIQEMDPSFVMSGVARGTGSLARHTLGGVADSAAMLTETAAKNMAVLTLDRKYAQRRDRVMRLKKNQTRADFVGGFESGLLKLVHGILEGVTGVVSKPIRGAERNGVEGFAKGVGKGLLGLLVKPVIGATDAITDTLIGVKESVEGINPLNDSEILQTQVRPRRALYGADRAVRTYRLDDATAATIQARSRLGGEEYLSHVDMTQSVALMSVRKLLILSENGDEVLLLPYKMITRVETHQDSGQYSVKIYLKKPKPDGTNYEEVICPNIEIADRLHKALSAVLN